MKAAEGRLDAWLTAQVGEEFSRSRIKALIKDGQVFLRGEPVTDPQRKVRTGDSFELTLPEPEDPTPQGEDIPLDMLYEDDDLIVIVQALRSRRPSRRRQLDRDAGQRADPPLQR